jgi:hypothetical protein
MDEELWMGVEFKLKEARFFLDQMGAVLVSHYRHPAYGPSVIKWQPDFYFYLDAFLGATRSIPDVIQKCFGLDPHSTKDWPQPLDEEESGRRKTFQGEFTSRYRAFSRQPLSRVRVGAFHWLGVPSVQTKAKGFDGQEYTGEPGQLIPSTAPRHFSDGTDPILAALFSKPLPIEPSWEEFTLKLPRDDGTTAFKPLFRECEAYLDSAHQLVQESKELCERIHRGAKLTSPLAVARELRS